MPQGRRVWPSLSVDEHLRLTSRDNRGLWTVDRIYRTFPRLAERRGNGGAELSGGEQQMLAIARALLLNPMLLVMDEPTEGLAPVIVQQVAAMLKHLAADGEISVLLIEQNIGVAIDVADTVAVMVNGRIAREMPAAELGADRDLQQRLLGVTVGGDDEGAEEIAAASDEPVEETRVFTIRRAGDDGLSIEGDDGDRAVRGYTRWNAADPAARPRDRSIAPPRRDSRAGAVAGRAGALPAAHRDARVVELPVAATVGRAAYVAGHLRHQGARAVLHEELSREARRAHGHRRPLHVGQAVAGHGASARGGAPPSARRAARCSRATADPRSPRWPSPSSTSSRGAATSAG